MIEATLFDACRTLFGPSINLSRDFLFYLQPGGTKSAFRRKAKETHPDLFAGCEPLVIREKIQTFQDVTKAYETLHTFLEEREKGLWSPTSFKSSFAAKPGGKNASKQPYHSNTAGNYYRGGIPFRTLEIGLYLYYRGIIPHHARISALVWQRSQRPNIGNIALRWGWLDKKNIFAISNYKGPYCRFGQRAVRLGLLTEFQVRTLLRYQQNLHKKLGQYFVEQGHIAPLEMERLVVEMTEHNARVLASMNRRQHGFAAN